MTHPKAFFHYDISPCVDVGNSGRNSLAIAPSITTHDLFYSHAIVIQFIAVCGGVTEKSTIVQHVEPVYDRSLTLVTRMIVMMHHHNH
ncbi:MAG: hypothetical protein AAFQ57_11125, partial [Cyanobacteria bacterium J06626_14]